MKDFRIPPIRADDYGTSDSAFAESNRALYMAAGVIIRGVGVVRNISLEEVHDLLPNLSPWLHLHLTRSVNEPVDYSLVRRVQTELHERFAWNDISAFRKAYIKEFLEDANKIRNVGRQHWPPTTLLNVMLVELDKATRALEDELCVMRRNAGLEDGLDNNE